MGQRMKTNGEGMNDCDRVLDLSQVNLTDEEGDDDGGCETIGKIDLVAPQDYEDTERPDEDTKVRITHCVKQRLAELEVKEGSRHAEGESAQRVQDRHSERNILSRYTR